MELQFNKTVLPCLRQLVRQVQDQEVTQEVKLADAMPDIGKVLSCWGQILIRSKQWHTGSMEMTGGVNIFTLYMPEDGSEPRCIQSWLPFGMKWDIPDTEYDGTISLAAALKNADARAISARKMMVRGYVSICATALEQGSMDVYTCPEVPKDVQLLQNKYPVSLPKEAGEKAFTLEETLHFPSGAVGVDKILRYEISPQIIDQKVMAQKVVFRGMALVHTLCRTEEGELKSWDFEVPFSQYEELEQTYEREADAVVTMAVTAAELELGEDKELSLKAGLLGQYIIYDKPIIELVEDAYSTERQVQLCCQELRMPTLLDSCTDKVQVRQPLQADKCMEIIDVSGCLSHPKAAFDTEDFSVGLQGSFQLLFKDDEGKLCSTTRRWEDTCKLSGDGSSKCEASAVVSGKPIAMLQGADVLAQTDVLVRMDTVSGCALQMVTGLELGEKQLPDPERPGLILRRANGDTLWDMAKSCGATVEAIRSANRLTKEPENGQLLLIPLP